MWELPLSVIISGGFYPFEIVLFREFEFMITTVINVKINTGDLDDKDFVADVLQKGEAMVQKADQLEQEIMAIVQSKI